MTVVSPRNPNLCLSCEQLTEGDSAELERLLSSSAPAETAARSADTTATPGTAECDHPFFVTPA